MMLIVDAHLDLAYNALHGRDVLRPAIEQTPDADGIPTVGVPDLRTGGVGLICGTLFVMPRRYGASGYRSPLEAHTQAQAQLDWYHAQERSGTIKLVRRSADLPAGCESGHVLHSIVLMECADPIVSPDDAPWWFAHGVRAVGMAWRENRYAGGTGCPGPLTDVGRALVRQFDVLGMIHDVSHMAEQSFWQLLELSAGPVMASHSNCRSIVPTDRQLSDEMILAIAARGGVIGINFYDRFLVPPGAFHQRRASLSDVMNHARHICDLTGTCAHIGIGTDMDGGLGREQIPHQISTSSDLPRLIDAAGAAGFTDAAIRAMLQGNWLRFFAAHLPG